MSNEGRKIGFQTEQRVIDLASQLGCQVDYFPDQDYGNKTDVIIDGRPFQVSTTGKSVGARARLERRGITTLVAGHQMSDANLIDQIIKGLE